MDKLSTMVTEDTITAIGQSKHQDIELWASQVGEALQNESAPEKKAATDEHHRTEVQSDSEKSDSEIIDELMEALAVNCPDSESEGDQSSILPNVPRKPPKHDPEDEVHEQKRVEVMGEVERLHNSIGREDQAAREKAAARSKQALKKLDNLTKQPKNDQDNGASSGQARQDSSRQTALDGGLIRRCLQCAIPSIAATSGTDMLELINLDILNEHLDLGIDLSEAWQRLLSPQTISSNIEAFLRECATDFFAWSILRREGHFKLLLWSVIQAADHKGEPKRNRQYLVEILVTLAEVFDAGVEWEIVPNRVPRAVMQMAIAVAREGPEPPSIDTSGEDFQIDPFMVMVAGKSESSLFGTPDTDSPRYWDFWIRRGGFGSDDS